MLYVVSLTCGLAFVDTLRPVVPSRRGLIAVSMKASELDILKEENAALREELLSSSMSTRSRLALPILGLAGLTAVNAPPDSSPIIESIQELLLEANRASKVDPRAEATMKAYFPGSISSLTCDRIVSGVLAKRGYTNANTLFATSTCPDEVNSKPGELVDLLKNRYGENFALGGLGGVPFTGRAGFSAYSHHVPTGGKMFILFAPHVGVEFDGKVGALQRVNQKDLSTACGAAVGAYKALTKENKLGAEAAYGVEAGLSDYFDAQINFIKGQLAPRLKGVKEAPNDQAFVAYQMYALVREFFTAEFLTAPGLWDYASEVTVLGGIMVNRGVGGDRFMPLMFQSRTKSKNSVVDLYPQAFGQPPLKVVTDVLGVANNDIFKYKLDIGYNRLIDDDSD